MLKIRLSRAGKKKQPSFRVVVQEHSSPVKGKFVEELGYYLPTANPKEFKIDLERVKHWISVGAQPSDSVAALLKKDGLDGMDKFIEPRNKKRKPKKEQPEEAPKAEEAAPAADAPVADAPAADAPVKEAPAEEKPAEEAPDAEEAPKEEPKEEAKEEAPAEEKAEESTPAEETKEDDKPSE